MFRDYNYNRGLSGAKQQLIKRTLVPTRLKVDQKGEYLTAQIPLKGRKVVGVLFKTKVVADEPIADYKRFFGVGAALQSSAAFVQSLNSERLESKNAVVSVNAGVNEKIYIASPVALGQIEIQYNGVAGGFNTPSVVTVTDALTAREEDYYLYESINDNLGQTQLELS